MANSIVHFEIFASNVERARLFYERVFDWQFEVAGPPDFYLFATGAAADPGLTHGLLAKRSSPVAVGALNAFRCTVRVVSIKDSIAAVEAAGGKLRSAVVDIPEVGKIAEVADTEGNVFCLGQYLPSHPLAAN